MAVPQRAAADRAVVRRGASGCARGPTYSRHRDLQTGHDASRATLGFFSTSGFTDDLANEAKLKGARILLADLATLYGDAS
jgi:hypothetical protein